MGSYECVVIQFSFGFSAETSVLYIFCLCDTCITSAFHLMTVTDHTTWSFLGFFVRQVFLNCTSDSLLVMKCWVVCTSSAEPCLFIWGTSMSLLSHLQLQYFSACVGLLRMCTYQPVWEWRQRSSHAQSRNKMNSIWKLTVLSKLHLFCNLTSNLL